MTAQNDSPTAQLRRDIKRARQGADFTQEALAERIDVARTTVSRWEKNDEAAASITWRRLLDIATHTGATFTIPPAITHDDDQEQAA